MEIDGVCIGSLNFSFCYYHPDAVNLAVPTVEVKKNFSSAQFAFFQFGAVLFNVEDLEGLSKKIISFQKICRNCITFRDSNLLSRSRIYWLTQKLHSRILFEKLSMIFYGRTG